MPLNKLLNLTLVLVGITLLLKGVTFLVINKGQVVNTAPAVILKKDQEPTPVAGTKRQLTAPHSFSGLLPYSLNVCTGHGNYYQCAQAIEKVQLQQYANTVKRVKGKVQIKLKNGELLELSDSDSPSYEMFILYSFIDFLSPIEHFLVHMQAQEGHGYLLINSKTGMKTAVWNIPILDATNSRFIVNSIECVYCASGIDIWRVDETRLVKEAHFEQRQFDSATQWLSAKVSWVNPTRIRVEAEGIYPGSGDTESRAYTLLKTNKSWVIVDPKHTKQ